MKKIVIILLLMMPFGSLFSQINYSLDIGPSFRFNNDFSAYDNYLPELETSDVLLLGGDIVLGVDYQAFNMCFVFSHNFENIENNNSNTNLYSNYYGVLLGGSLPVINDDYIIKAYIGYGLQSFLIQHIISTQTPIPLNNLNQNSFAEISELNLISNGLTFKIDQSFLSDRLTLSTGYTISFAERKWTSPHGDLIDAPSDKQNTLMVSFTYKIFNQELIDF